MALLELDPLLQPPPASGLFSGVTALPWACSHPGGNAVLDSGGLRLGVLLLAEPHILAKGNTKGISLVSGCCSPTPLLFPVPAQS